MVMICDELKAVLKVKDVKLSIKCMRYVHAGFTIKNLQEKSLLPWHVSVWKYGIDVDENMNKQSREKILN